MTTPGQLTNLMQRLALWSLMLIAPAVSAQVAVPANTGACLNAEEVALVQLVNNYRAANGKSQLPATRWLSTTAQWHVWDRMANNAVGGSCNSHSWSTAMPALWQGVCYTPNHSEAAQMWAKPRQISTSPYYFPTAPNPSPYPSAGHGYENTADAGGTMTAALALLIWQGSPAHRSVILNEGSWSGIPFHGMGVGIVGNYAVLWFGDAVDPGGTMGPCGNEIVFSTSFE